MKMKNLLVDTLKQTPLRDQAKGLELKQEEQLFEMLHKLLMDLRYLIVVDDLDQASLINKLLVPFVDSMNGSRVIFITPNAEMQKFADPWTLDLQLPTNMTDEECKKLLRVSITGDDDTELEMTTPEQRILSKRNRSPPAISLLGGLLSAVEESNWEALVHRLGECPTLDDVTCLSFDALPYMMKLCVLCMALFPKESEVPTRRLFRQWAAEGLLAEVADGSVQMRSAEDCFLELESRNFVHGVQRRLDGSARSCRMPAFLHEFFSRKAKESRLLQIQYSSGSVSKEESRGRDPDAGQRAPSRHMPAFLHEFFCPEAKESRLLQSQHSCGSVPCKESRGMEPDAEQSVQNQHKQSQNTATGHYGYKAQFLKSFASFNTRKLGTQAREIEDLPKSPLLDGRPDLLRVIDLEGVYKPVLPNEFGNTLSNLRYLGLRWTALDSIPESVGNLLLLETLDLKHTNITKPHDTCVGEVAQPEEAGGDVPSRSCGGGDQMHSEPGQARVPEIEIEGPARSTCEP
ncbi:putative disease resistance protein At1g59780 [Eucalyptus grandis]|uniref:putative disease resistance protein At1g59780 n=1 Tax=Eucalyptus grandis TaxID=71139 RepID=UPI00192EC1DD|nr:putative disease resistance protein At1g59780 [Eucalyptus grandis]